jgi:hypothetical protein
MIWGNQAAFSPAEEAAQYMAMPAVHLSSSASGSNQTASLPVEEEEVLDTIHQASSRIE